jgi:transposase-like protein
MGKKSKLEVSQQQEVVLMLLRREEPAAVLARRYGISEATLYHWRDKFLQAGRSALANGAGKSDAASRRVVELEQALAERDRVVGELTIANRVLKKVSGGWSSTMV